VCRTNRRNCITQGLSACLQDDTRQQSFWTAFWERKYQIILSVSNSLPPFTGLHLSWLSLVSSLTICLKIRFQILFPFTLLLSCPLYLPDINFMYLEIHTSFPIHWIVGLCWKVNQKIRVHINNAEDNTVPCTCAISPNEPQVLSFRILASNRSYSNYCKEPQD
jgi:hypothetical protein